MSHARRVSTWLVGDDDWWFGGDNGDRMDVIPEQLEYKAGETAKFQVRMPFREATALGHGRARRRALQLRRRRSPARIR